MITRDEFSRLSHYDQGDYINEIFKQNGLDEPLEWDIHGYWIERKNKLSLYNQDLCIKVQ